MKRSCRNCVFGICAKQDEDLFRLRCVNDTMRTVEAHETKAGLRKRGERCRCWMDLGDWDDIRRWRFIRGLS